MSSTDQEVVFFPLPVTHFYHSHTPLKVCTGCCVVCSFTETFLRRFEPLSVLMLSLQFSQQEEKKEPGTEKCERSRSYFRLLMNFLISLVCCLPEAEQDFGEKQPDNEFSGIYANIHRLSSPPPDIYLQQPSYYEQHVKILQKYQIFPQRAFKTIWTLPPPPPLSPDHRWEATLPTHQWISNPEVGAVWVTVQMCRVHGRFNCPICWWEFFTLYFFLNRFLRHSLEKSSLLN